MMESMQQDPEIIGTEEFSLSPREFAQIRNVSRMYVYMLLSDGKLEGAKKNSKGEWRIPSWVTLPRKYKITPEEISETKDWLRPSELAAKMDWRSGQYVLHLIAKGKIKAKQIGRYEWRISPSEVERIQNDTENFKSYVTLVDFSIELGLSRSVVQNLIYLGKIKAIRKGGRWLIEKEEADRYRNVLKEEKAQVTQVNLIVANGDKTLSSTEAASVLGLSKSKLYEQVRYGQLKPILVRNRSYTFAGKDIDEYLQKYGKGKHPGKRCPHCGKHLL